jgi:mRNA interferase RelE/StbE
MKVIFLKSFFKDLERISDRKDKDAILKMIHSCEEVNSLSEINAVKKLSGFNNAYRIRVRNFRVGIFLEGNEIVLAKVAHRKDVYKIFP